MNFSADGSIYTGLLLGHDQVGGRVPSTERFEAELDRNSVPISAQNGRENQSAGMTHMSADVASDLR